MRKIIPLLCTLFLLGCFSYNSEIEPNQFHREFLLGLSMDEQVERFHEYDPETQYELLIVGNQVVPPPAQYLAGAFAKQGKSIVPFLRAKLAAAKKELTVRDIVVVFCDMQRLGTYDVKGDASLIALVEERIATMQSDWKLTVQSIFEERVLGRSQR